MSASREKKLRRELREAEENSDVVKKVKKKKKQMTAAQAKRLRSGITTAVVILLVAVFALLIFVNSGVLQTHLTAATVGSHKLTPVQYNYFYQDAYNNIKSSYTNYGYWDYVVDTSKPVEDQDFTEDQTWGAYISETALSNAQQTYALYDAAVADGFTLDEDDQASIDALPENIESYAKSAGYGDGDEYLESIYGKGAAVESYVDYVTVQQTGSSYSSQKEDSFTYTTDELEAYYKENKNDFDTVTYRSFSVSTEDGDTAAAKSTADAMAAELDGTEKSFSDAAYKYAAEDAKESYEDESYTLTSNASYSGVSTDYADWLFSADRAPGESQVFPTDTGYVVVMFVSREDNHYRTVNVRHILAQVPGYDEGTSTDEDWETCEATINDILAEWESSDMTEETFASMATAQSDDTGSAENGGLLEDVYKGQMVQEFNDWCFEEGRQVGDYGIVKTVYGYHLIYFSGYGDERWIDQVETAKRSADYTAWLEAETDKETAATQSFGQLFTKKDLEP